MSRNKSLRRAVGETLLRRATRSTRTTSRGLNLEGQIKEFEDIHLGLLGEREADPHRRVPGAKVQVMLVRNMSGARSTGSGWCP
jgi:hypothetical protein